jgi:hypothetical protein
MFVSQLVFSLGSTAISHFQGGNHIKVKVGTRAITPAKERRRNKDWEQS